MNSADIKHKMLRSYTATNMHGLGAQAHPHISSRIAYQGRTCYNLVQKLAHFK